MELILENDKSSVNHQDKTSQGRTPLHILVEEHPSVDVKSIKALLDNGANINSCDNWGLTPLHLARKSDLEVARYLWKEGANIESRDHGDQTPVYSAIAEGNIPLLKFYFDEAKYPIEGTSDDKQDPLTSSIAWRQLEAADLLLERGAKFRGDGINSGYQKILTGRIASSEVIILAVIKLLHKWGADVNYSYLRGETPLHGALHQEYKSIVEFLLENGANINAMDDRGVTPLATYLRRWNDRDMISLLIDRGADPSMVSKKELDPELAGIMETLRESYLRKNEQQVKERQIKTEDKGNQDNQNSEGIPNEDGTKRGEERREKGQGVLDQIDLDKQQKEGEEHWKQQRELRRQTDRRGRREARKNKIIDQVKHGGTLVM
ncbi:Ankyrin-1 [Dactylellina cionopaga]|nr:Ankyrin-1 [Dactylellina cionopaga]